MFGCSDPVSGSSTGDVVAVGRNVFVVSTLVFGVGVVGSSVDHGVAVAFGVTSTGDVVVFVVPDPVGLVVFAGVVVVGDSIGPDSFKTVIFVGYMSRQLLLLLLLPSMVSEEVNVAVVLEG
jgi:hypothetical protein